MKDLKISIRQLIKNPGFTATVVLTLAVCIGANTTIFSVLYDLVLKPLPFEDPDRLVQVYNVTKDGEFPTASGSGWGQYRDFKEQADLFEGFALAYTREKVSDSRQLKIMSVTSDFFEVMKVKPARGRFFTSSEHFPTPGNVAVLTRSAWENEYASDPDIIGKEVHFLNEGPFTIVGVAPRSVEALDSKISLLIPLREDTSGRRARGIDPSHLWGRLKPNVSHEQAIAQLMSIDRHWHESVTDILIRRNFGPDRWRIELTRPNPFKTRLVLLQGGALFVLLVGCSNTLNLMLSRVFQRRNELSLRYLFGAGGTALSRLMLTDSIIIAGLGAGAGLVISWGSLQTINYHLARIAPTSAPISLNGSIFALTLLIAGGVVLLMGLVPLGILWKSGRLQQVESNSRGASASQRSRVLSNSLVVFQIAIAFTLLTGAGLLLESFKNVLDVDPGFDASSVVQGEVRLGTLYRNEEERRAVTQRIMDSMKEIPGVEEVGSTLFIHDTVGRKQEIDSVSIRGGSFTTEESSPKAMRKAVSSAFFETMGIPIIEGRSFFPDENRRASVVIDEAFAKRFLKDQPALGAELKHGLPPAQGESWPRVVGIAKRANFEGLEERDGAPVVYYRLYSALPSFTLLVRATRDSESIIREMQSKLRGIDSRLHIYDPTALASSLSNLHHDRKAITLLIGIFASIALFLSAIGTYGVLAYDMQQRRHEMGIRTAIGATRAQLLSMVLRQGLSKTGLGLALGLIGSLFLSQFLQSRLFDVTALDLQTYLIAFTILFTFAMTASYLPARRAARANPMEALRGE